MTIGQEEAREQTLSHLTSCSLLVPSLDKPIQKPMVKEAQVKQQVEVSWAQSKVEKSGGSKEQTVSTRCVCQLIFSHSDCKPCVEAGTKVPGTKKVLNKHCKVSEWLTCGL